MLEIQRDDDASAATPDQASHDAGTDALPTGRYDASSFDSGPVETGSVARVRPLVAPIVADLGLDIYDLEHRGGVLRLTLDTPIGTEGGPTLDTIALASRLLSKELDAVDPIASRYTLEVTTPGVERPLRTADHFRRALGQKVAIRLADVGAADRRIAGVITGADDDAVTVAAEGDAAGAEDRRIEYHQIDRARTIFEWPAQAKGAGSKRSSKKESSPARERTRARDQASPAPRDGAGPASAVDEGESQP